MPRQHFLGAAFIGGFSNETSLPARERALWVRRRNSQQPYVVNADSVAWRRDMFTTRTLGDSPNLVDSHLGMPDPRIAATIDRFVKGTLTPHDWVATLVPFVATLFVRNPEFSPRFMERLREIGGGHVPDVAMGHTENTNVARVLEMQRLLSP